MGKRSGVWLRNNQENKKGELIISDLREEDEGVYTCRVANSLGAVTYNVSLRTEWRVVASRPEIQVMMPGNHSVLVGEDVTLECRLTVPDVSRVTWFKHYQVDGKWLDTQGGYYKRTLQDSEDLPEDETKLLLRDVTLETQGVYSCHFHNMYGKAESLGWLEVRESSELEEVQERLDAAGHSASRTLLLLVGVGGGAGLLLSIVALIFCMRFREEQRRKFEVLEAASNVVRWTRKVIVERLEDDEEGLGPRVRVERVEVVEGEWDPGTELYTFEEDVEWELARELLEFKKELGCGAFGKVVQALAHGCKQGEGGIKMASTEESFVVAVKMLKEEHTEEEVVDLVKEVEIMKSVGRHINIVNLLGVCTQPPRQPFLVILEFAELGSLKELLVKRRDEVSYRGMLDLAWQVARGMEYLAGRRCVHRDLAARNVLVARGGVAKIADFGLARDLQEGSYYRKIGEAKLPVLWMAPESLFEGISSTQSDVWSFGVLLWEVVTWGERPYPGHGPGAVMELVREGYRMGRPQHCPLPLYQVMWSCWEVEVSCFLS